MTITSTFSFQGSNYSVLTSTLFSELINSNSFQSNVDNALMALISHQNFELGKTNIKINGHIFLIAINLKTRLIFLLSQNALYESSQEPPIHPEIKNLNQYQKIPDIFLIYPNPKDLNKIELNGEAKEKFLYYKRSVTSHIKKYRPSLFERLNNFVLGLICDYHTLRTQLLKFIAVVPALTHEKEGHTLKESFLETAQNIVTSKEKMPAYLKPLFHILGALTPLIPSRVFKVLVEYNISFIAKRFICTEDKTGAAKIIKRLHKTSRNCTFDQLGELVICQSEAEDYCQKILDLINSPALFATAEKYNPSGIPSHHISIKTSALSPHFNEDPDAFLFVYKDIKPRLFKLFSAAEKHLVYLNFDAEHYHYRDLTVDLIFHFLNEHKQFEAFPYFGFVLQAYLKDSHIHFQKILSHAKKRNHAVPLRLVKGAYWDAETVDAKAKNYESPQFLNKIETDIQFRHLIHLILVASKNTQLCIASHNVDDHCYGETVRDLFYPQAPIIEHQTLHMTYEPLSMAAAKIGWPMRNYLPTGSLLVGMGYLVRRIMENASQTGVLTATRHQHFSMDYQSLTENLIQKIKSNQYKADPSTDIAPSHFIPNNSSHLFHSDEHLHFKEAKINTYLDLAKTAKNTTPIYSKYNANRVLSEITFHNKEETLTAIEYAVKAKPKWESTSSLYRANLLQSAAQLMRLEKFALSKLIMEEAGKTRMEALGDVDEAIDFLNYYAAEILKDSESKKLPRGVFAIIAPWNFPLAILCGMSAAALAAGNTVIMKPAEQTPLTALALYHILIKANIPNDVVQILIGDGEVVGATLVESTQVKGIAFTGSKQVGVHIYCRSLELFAKNNLPPRSVITEMGGKNAIIICKDAELDQAISSSIYSSFGHAGQKCSACSRIIVHESIINQFSNRFVARASEISIGSPEFAETFINPLISKEEKEKTLKNAADMIQFSNKYNEKILLNHSQQPGISLVGPLIIQCNEKSLLDKEHPIYREMFAPLIYLIPFKMKEEAVAIFNNTQYALTGGVFTQSDLTIDYFLKRLKAGNLYFNRNITGARVAIEPFGGFYMSGTGPKAGGPHYLNAFKSHLFYRIPLGEKVTEYTGNPIVKPLEASDHESKSLRITLPQPDPLFSIPGQTSYLDYQIKKEEVLFVFYQTEMLAMMINLLDLCLQYKLNFKIACLSNEVYELIKGKAFEPYIIQISKKDFAEFQFSTNLDLIVHNNEEEISSLVYKVFSDKKYYQKKMLKFISYESLTQPVNDNELAKILCEPRTIAINTMRYGAPLEET